MHPTTEFDLAMAEIRSGQPERAVQRLKAQPDDRRCAARLREMLVGERRLAEAAEVARSLASGDDAEALVSAALLRHLAQDPAGAAELCQRTLQQHPDHAAALNHLGRALHNLGRTEKALAAFERAVAVAPDFAEAWHNLAHVLRARGQLHRARQAFETALEHAPGFLSARLQLGVTLYAMDQPQPALDCFESVLARTPDEVEAHVGAGLALHLLGRMKEARAHYERALQLAPEHQAAHYYLGCLLNAIGDSAAAIASLQRALQLQPDDVEAWAELAGVYEQDSRIDDAAQVVERGLALAPAHPALNLEAAKLERRRGDARAAAERLRRIDPRRLPSRTAQQYWFELGQALDRCEDIAGAMRAFETGNALAARSLRRQAINPKAFDQKLDQLFDWLGRDAPGSRPQPADPTDDSGADLCFLVGMPRSGTTLLDTMLSAHPQVVSIEEQATLEHVIWQLTHTSAGYPGAIEGLGADDVAALRRLYRSACARHLGTRSAPLVLDKLPLRCLHVGLIRRLFPQARILFALRHPGDVVLSSFMQQYAPNEAFIHFDTLQDSTRMYCRVLAFWERAAAQLDLNLHYLRYEDLIAEPARTLADVCRFLGIEPDPAMLDDAARKATRERVRTNSYQQVAEALYTRANGRWQRYRPYLEPHIDALRPLAERLGYSFD